MTVKKRGRPFGSKNKPKESIYRDPFKTAKALRPFQKDVVSEFQKTLDEWDQMEKQTNWEEIAKKLQVEINLYKNENEQLAQVCIQRLNEIEHLKYLVSYLEKRIENSAI
jgi:hypothetical protein